ncbi:MAG: DcrB-related protein [Deltaproteobacteria bacterium]|nr:DcrB-related protein [Deltaproteobacteria bacterium]
MPSIRHNDLTLQTPEGWEDGTQVILIAPAEGGFRPNLIASHDQVRPGTTLKSFAAAQLTVLQRTLQHFKLVKEAPARFGEVDGLQREHTFDSNGSPLAQVQFCFLAGESVHTLTYTHLASKLAQARKTAAGLFASVRIG